MQSWLKAEDKPVWIKQTPVNRGPVTRHPSLGGPVMKQDEISPRRYSVIHQLETDRFLLMIGSVSYTSQYDSHNELEPLNKYLKGEFQVLVAAEADEEEALGWDGMAQSIVDFDYQPKPASNTSK